VLGATVLSLEARTYMSEITPKLHQLESIFRLANAPILEHFNSGLPKEEIKRFFAENGVPEHPDLIALYHWHNGVKSIYGLKSDLIDLIPMGCFPNLTEMLALRNDFLSYDYFEVENRHEYVPILSGGEDDMHLLQTSTGQIYYSSPGIQVYCDAQFRSLTSMLDFILDCHNKGIFRLHPQDGLLVREDYWAKKFDYQN
jgi:hypothetical protein